MSRSATCSRASGRRGNRSSHEAQNPLVLPFVLPSVWRRFRHRSYGRPLPDRFHHVLPRRIWQRSHLRHGAEHHRESPSSEDDYGRADRRGLGFVRVALPRDLSKQADVARPSRRVSRIGGRGGLGNIAGALRRLHQRVRLRFRCTDRLSHSSRGQDVPQRLRDNLALGGHYRGRIDVRCDDHHQIRGPRRFYPRLDCLLAHGQFLELDHGIRLDFLTHRRGLLNLPSPHPPEDQSGFPWSGRSPDQRNELRALSLSHHRDCDAYDRDLRRLLWHHLLDRPCHSAHCPAPRGAGRQEDDPPLHQLRRPVYDRGRYFVPDVHAGGDPSQRHHRPFRDGHLRRHPLLPKEGIR